MRSRHPHMTHCSNCQNSFFADILNRKCRRKAPCQLTNESPGRSEDLPQGVEEVAAVQRSLLAISATAALFLAVLPAFGKEVAPALSQVQQECDLTAVEVNPPRAFVEFLPQDGAPPLRHILAGRLQEGEYTHLVLDGRPKQYAVRDGRGRLAAETAVTLATPLYLSRRPDGLRLYSGGRLVAEIPVSEGPLVVACAWEKGGPPWRIRVQDASALRFGDDFMRHKLGDGDGWTIESGHWWIVQQAEAGAAPNAFMLQVHPRGTVARMLTGHGFWNNYTLEVSVSVGRESALGMVFGATRDTCYRLFLRDAQAKGIVEVAHVRGDEAEVLASRAIGLCPGHWTRLSVVVAEGQKLRVAVDGVPLLECDAPRATFGRVGLCAEKEGGRFDDFCVSGLDEPVASDDMRPVVQFSKTFKNKPWFEKDDRDVLLHRWASDTDAWEDAALVLDGREWRGFLAAMVLFGDFAAELPAHPAPQTLALQGADRAILFSHQLPPATTARHFARRGDALELDGQRVGTLAGSQGVRLGLYAEQGLADNAPRPDLRSRTVRQEFFETAPTMWLPVSGAWQPTIRWTCFPKWNFFGGVGPDDVVLFSKERYDGSQCHEFYYGMKDVLARQYEQRRYIRRDVNFSFCTNGRDLSSGYTVMYGGRHNRASYLMKGRTIVAWNDLVRFPEFHAAPDEQQLHTKWWRFRVEKLGRRIRVFQDQTLLFDWTDTDPDAPTGGHIAFWTHRNGIVYARINSSAEVITNAAAQYLPVTGSGRLGGWLARHPSRVRLEPGAAGRVRARNLFGGGSFAVQWEMPTPINLAETPKLRLPFAAGEGARVNLHLVVGGRGLIFALNAPTNETYRVLGQWSDTWDSWDAFVAAPLREPVVDARSLWDRDNEIVEVNLRDEIERRFPTLAPLTLTSLIVGNSSNVDYLLAGFGGNTSQSWYEVGRPEFMRAE